MKLKYFIPVILGVVCGILSTYPIELKFLPCIIFWGLAGAILGLFTEGKREIIRAGILFGIFLAVAFLFSRFGGTFDKVPSYSLFVALASVGSTIGGIGAVFIGSKLGSWFNKKN